MQQRFDIKRANDKRRKDQTRAAKEKRREKNRQVIRDVQAMKKLAVEVNREREERLLKLGLLKQRPLQHCNNNELGRESFTTNTQILMI